MIKSVYFRLKIRNIVPRNIKNSRTSQVSRKKKKSCIPLNYPCKPCENYIQVGFTNTRES